MFVKCNFGTEESVIQ